MNCGAEQIAIVSGAQEALDLIPDLALDGDPNTSWEVAAFSNPVGQALQIDLSGPVTTNQVTLTQPLIGARERWVTKATLSFDGGHSVTVNLLDASRAAKIYTISVVSRTVWTWRSAREPGAVLPHDDLRQVQ